MSGCDPRYEYNIMSRPPADEIPPQDEVYNGPTIRLVNPAGFAMYPIMVKDSKGRWVYPDPDYVRRFMAIGEVSNR